MSIQPFRIEVPESQLTDLRHRIAETRWPDEIPGIGWEDGTPVAYLRELLAYWKDRFDWRAQEEALNRLPQYLMEINGRRVHFVHARGTGPNAVPLLITHGWPSTFFEMVKLIPLLTEHFDVIVPSIPGFGFSEARLERGFDSWKIAETWKELMDRLGYSRFCAHGGDVGAGVTSRLALLFPESVAGIHLTALMSPTLPPDAVLTEMENALLAYQQEWHEKEGSYWHQQRTRPQSLAYGLTDSPAGLASWIVEKFYAWSDCHGDLESRFSKDELLTHLTIYWVTRTIGSASRLYRENWGTGYRALKADDEIAVPTSIGQSRERADQVPREWAERLYKKIQRWTEYPRGGHFMAMEEPRILADDLIAAFSGR